MLIIKKRDERNIGGRLKLQKNINSKDKELKVIINN
jgi:hypothetical protein